MSAARVKPVKEPTEELSVARVAVDIPLPHLDRPFDYLVSTEQDPSAQPGCRVRVRFSGRLVDGVILERVAKSEHAGRLAFLERVVSAEPVVATEIARLARAVADRWAGTMADVQRLAVPPRHAKVEAEAVASPRDNSRGFPALEGGESAIEATRGLERYVGGQALRERLANGESPRASWSVLPGHWPGELAIVVAATLASGRGVVVVVPDGRDVDRMDAALTYALGPGRHVALTADLGPAERYRRFLAARRGVVRCVVGSRAAVWAPVRDLGLVVVWDDGDDVLAEPRAPYCHARDVAVLRTHLTGAALVLAGYAVSTEAASLTVGGWLEPLDATDAARRDELPTVRSTGDDDDLDRDLGARAARLPTVGWRAAREALAAGHPVLVLVPRRGYQPSLACAHCRMPARCSRCAGPLARTAAAASPSCRWCGVVATSLSCSFCGNAEMRAVVVGAGRTAEELGRAFPGTAIRHSEAGNVLAEQPDSPALVVSTPGAEPVAANGYGAALLLDGWALLGRPDLRASEEALRRWMNAAALVRPGGAVVVVAPGELRPVQALVRWQPRWSAERELAERAALHLPPGARMAALTGGAAAVRELLAAAEMPPTAEVLGPVPAPVTGTPEGAERLLVRVPRRDGAALALALKQAAAVRSARKTTDPVRIELDPQQIG